MTSTLNRGQFCDGRQWAHLPPEYPIAIDIYRSFVQTGHWQIMVSKTEIGLLQLKYYTLICSTVGWLCISQSIFFASWDETKLKPQDAYFCFDLYKRDQSKLLRPQNWSSHSS